MIDSTFVEAIHATFPAFEGTVTYDTTAAEVPGWDSFGHVQLIFELEDRYGIKIDPQRTLACQNVGELFDVIQGKTD